MNLTSLDGVGKRPHDRLLADDVGERAGTMPSVKGLSAAGHQRLQSTLALAAAGAGSVPLVAIALKPSAGRLSAALRTAGRAARKPLAHALGPAVVVCTAALLWLLSGVGFVNYDTLYGLVWGQQLTHGQTPQYGLPIAPTPHPLVELLGVIVTPLGASAATAIAVALAFLALAGCGWVLYRLGSLWLGPAAGAVAALVLLTRVPVLSYGVRAYVDVPYVLFVLGALLFEARKRRAGAPVLALLALAGLLRPEAWAFSALYWLYLAFGPVGPERRASRRRLAWLALLAAAAPILWVASDLLVTGDPAWSLTNTKHTAHELGRVTGAGNVPQYVPRRIGEVLHPVALVAAALGGLFSLAWLWPRIRLGAIAGVVAVFVFALMAAFGLPIDTRYAFLASAILCVFCGAGAFGWTALPQDDRRRKPWMALGALLAVALLVSLPSQIRSAHHELSNLERQQAIQSDLLALVHHKQIDPRCGPVGVPNHAPVPLLALYLAVPPAEVVSAEAHQIDHGTYVEPASIEVERSYVLDPRDPHMPVSIPPGFSEAATNRSWLVFKRC